MLDTDSHMHLTIGEARTQFTDIINRVAYKGERLIIDRYHKPMMALVSVEDLEFLETLEDQQDLQEAKKRLMAIKKEGTLSRAELNKYLKET